jgi:5-bromo-4-chloroindolyl phosphate hydrolysis protein
MNSFLSFFFKTALAVPSAITIWTLSYFAFYNTFFISSAAALGGGALIYWLASLYSDSRFLKKNGLSRKEYRYIKKNLEEAKKKISRLHKLLFSIRHLPSLKERIELLRMIRKIYALTKKEPKRFYQAERFYFSHLDSVLELTEKYEFLSSQPKKNRDLDWSLNETRKTLSELSRLIEKDLYQVIENDLDTLNFEIDVAKHSIKTSRGLESDRSVPEGVNTGKKKGIQIPGRKAAEDALAALEAACARNKAAEEEKSRKKLSEAESSIKKPAEADSDEKWEEFKRKHANQNKNETHGSGTEENTGPRFYINTKREEKEEVKISLGTREERYKDKNRRFPE